MSESRPMTASIEALRQAAGPAEEHPLRAVLRRYWRNKLAVLGAGIILLMLVVTLTADWLAPHPATRMNMTKRLAPPSAEFWLGTDEFGRDIYSRIIYGTVISFQVGVIAVGIALTAGTALGLMAGYRGGGFDSVIMRTMDIIFAFPAVLLAIAIIGVMGSSLANVMIAIGIVNVPVFARLVRGSVLAVKEMPYTEAARALGAGDLRIVLQHILPNVGAPLIVQASLGFAFAVLTEANLSFLGLGNKPPSPSWGAMLNTAYGLMQNAPWAAIFPGLAISLAVTGFNLVGDGLRDALDPRLKR